jgi:CDP-glucose 4,6-dehydratase
MENLVSVLDRYRGKKVLVTGHTGFKGTWFIAMLHKLGATLKGYALAPEDSKEFYNSFDASFIESVIADIRDREKIKKEVLSFQPDFIFHLAAQPLVLRSYEIPAETFDINVVGTANLFEAVRLLDKKCSIVIVTTDKVYENKEQAILYNEHDALGGYDPYSASKACTELVVSSSRNSFFNTGDFSTHKKAIASARAGNVIGGGDWSKNRIIPDTVFSLMNDEVIKLRNPSAIRPWQHVLEPLAGYLLLGVALDKDPLLYSKPYNFGPLPEDHLTVKELVQLAIKSWGDGKMEVLNREQPHEANLLQLDISRAIQELGWRPKLNATEAVQWTVDWYKKDNKSKADFTFQQIDNYLTK